MNNWKQYTLAAVIVAAAGFAGIKGLHKNMPSDFRDAVSDVKAGAFENLKDQGGSVTLDKDISLPQVAAPVMATLPERGNTVRIYTGVGEPLDGFEVYRPGDQMFLDGTNVPVDTLAA